MILYVAGQREKRRETIDAIVPRELLIFIHEVSSVRIIKPQIRNSKRVSRYPSPRYTSPKASKYSVICFRDSTSNHGDPMFYFRAILQAPGTDTLDMEIDSPSRMISSILWDAKARKTVPIRFVHPLWIFSCSIVPGACVDSLRKLLLIAGIIASIIQIGGIYRKLLTFLIDIFGNLFSGLRFYLLSRARSASDKFQKKKRAWAYL